MAPLNIYLSLNTDMILNFQDSKKNKHSHCVAGCVIDACNHSKPKDKSMGSVNIIFEHK